MIVYYLTKFHFNTMNSFRVMGCRLQAQAPKKSPCQIGLMFFYQAIAGLNNRSLCIVTPSKANKQQSYVFIKKFECFTRGHYKFAIIWQTKKLTSMFRLKDNNIHPSHVVYHCTCADCSASYVGKFSRNFKTRKQVHEDATKQSEPTQHLRENPHHHFNWRVIAIASPLGIRRILESMFIAKFQPCLNKQVHSYTLNLFPKGIT